MSASQNSLPLRVLFGSLFILSNLTFFVHHFLTSDSLAKSFCTGWVSIISVIRVHEERRCARDTRKID